MDKTETMLDEELRRKATILSDAAERLRERYPNSEIADSLDKNAADLLRIAREGGVREKIEARDGRGLTYSAN